MKKDKHETPVIFRRWPAKTGYGVIALFPAMPGTNDPHTCGSYEHVGQHSAADPQHVISATRSARPAEYRKLERELTSLGYRLRIYRRHRAAFLEARRAALK